jgi:hypothetical protein
LKPATKLRRAGPGDEQLVGKREPGESGAGTQARPTLPPVGGQQLLGRLLEPLAVGGAPLFALGVGELGTYVHASPEDLRAELERAGVLERLGALT